MLNDILNELQKREKHLSKHACLSVKAIRRRTEERQGFRQDFSVDCDRILHSKAYTRYIDKTQVFYLISNDHITHRVLHVQLVSKIARTIGRFLSLNEDLIEAIALGHDIGHPPFGHDGEKILSGLCKSYGLNTFQHNLQSVKFLDLIEKKGKGLNLTLQTLDGILCHDGEVHNPELEPEAMNQFSDFDLECSEKKKNPSKKLIPKTMEGCVVRLADTIGYIGRDLEDAIGLNLIKRDDVPKTCIEILGNSNGTIVYNLVSDLITNSYGKNSIGFSPKISDSLLELKKFNYEHIYLNPKIKLQKGFLENCYSVLFENYLRQLDKKNKESVIFKNYLLDMNQSYKDNSSNAAIACDFIAGMTDDYFINQAKIYGCEIPRIII